MNRIALCLIVTLAAAPFAAAQDQPDQPEPRRIQNNPDGADQPPAPPPIDADADFEPPNPLKVRADFVEHVQSSDDYTADQRRAAAKIIGVAPQDGGGVEPSLISQSLRVLYPDYDQAMKLLGQERTDEAIALLGKLAERDDPYLTAYAKFYMARAYAMDEHHEKALPLLEQITVDEQIVRTLHSGDAMFLKGMAQAETLDRKAALKTLKTFAKNYPFASERMVIGALHLIDELSYLEEGSIVDVSDRMDYSRRRLDIEESGKTTQGEQQRIVAMLDKLIEEAEKEENKGGGGGGGGGGGQQGAPGGGGAPSGNQQSGGPADQSSVSPGAARIGDLGRVIRGNESWGEAREKEREEVLNAIKAKYPERYRELVEQYYRTLQEENR